MKLKLFGKDIFEFGGSKGDVLASQVIPVMRESKFLPDFHTMRNYSNESNDLVWSLATPEIGNETGITATAGGNNYVLTKKQETEKKKKFALTPKRVFELKFLNKKDFKINTDEKYVDEQVQSFKDKLSLIKSAEFDMSRGVNDIASILLRLENRKKYPVVKDFFEQFAYTTSDRINKVVSNHNNLKLGGIDQFMADLPKEAVDVMKAYNVKTNDLCGKQAVFYIIADKKDFQKTENRRDPILLAQSPFAHVWQILGAWDEEMLFLEEL